MWCQFLWSKGLLWVQRRWQWVQNPAVWTPLGVLSSVSVMANTCPCIFLLSLTQPLTLTDRWACSHWAPKMQHQSSSVGGLHAVMTCCIEFYSRSYLERGGYRRRSSLHFSKSVRHIDNPKSHPALALEDVASLSCKSSERSLQPAIGTDWLNSSEKRKVWRNIGQFTVLTGWVELGWK